MAEYVNEARRLRETTQRMHEIKTNTGTLRVHAVAFGLPFQPPSLHDLTLIFDFARWMADGWPTGFDLEAESGRMLLREDWVDKVGRVEARVGLSTR